MIKKLFGLTVFIASLHVFAVGSACDDKSTIVCAENCIASGSTMDYCSGTFGCKCK